MRSVTSLGFRTFRRNTGRYVLTITGVVIGVAIAFGVLVSNATTTREIERRTGGESSWYIVGNPVGAFEAGMPFGAVARASRLPGVAHASGALGFNVPRPRTKSTPAGHDEQLWLYGWVRESGSAKPRPFAGNPGERTSWTGREPREGALEVGMSETIASQLGLKRGSTVDLATPAGTRTFTLTWLLRRADRKPLEGVYVYTSMRTVRELSGKGEVLTSLSVALGQGVEPSTWVTQHGDALGPEVQLRTQGSAAWAQEFRRAAEGAQAAFSGMAVVALWAGGFLIYLTMSIAIIERTRTYGTLRALGASSRQVRRVVLSEAMALGLLAVAGGLVLGLGVAAASVAYMARLYDIGMPPLVVRPTSVALALLLGLVVTLVSALVPARRAARLAPVEAMRGPHTGEQRTSRGWIAGIVLLCAGAVAAQAPTPQSTVPILQAVRWTSSMLILTGAVLLVPPILRPLARLVGAGTRRLAPGVGDASVMHLAKERSRSAYTLSLVMVVLGLVFAIGAGDVSYRRLFERSLQRSLPADIGVYGTNMDDDAIATVRNVPGVAGLTAVGFGETRLADAKRTTVSLTFIDPESFLAIQGFDWATGNDRAAREALTRGGAVVVPRLLADEQRLRPGSTINLETSSGPKPVKVAGVYFSTERVPRLFVSADDGRAFFGVVRPGGIAVKLLSDADAAVAARVIERRLGDGVTVRIVSEQRAEAQSSIGRFFRIFYAGVLAAAVIGLLGLANTLAASILSRTREIGILRAVGAGRRQLRAMVVVEAATLALVALVLALPLGWALSVTTVRASGARLGLEVPYVFPWRTVPVVAAAALLTGLVAAISPARRAARIDPVAALRFE